MKPEKRNFNLRDWIFSKLCALMVILMVVSIIVGIWYDPFPFWKAFGTEIFLFIIFNTFTD